MINIETQYHHVISRLKNELPAHLLYHNYRHTQYVYEQTKLIAAKENASEHETYLLLLAALYHDTGFLINAVEHEQLSCRILENEVPLSNTDLKKVQGMIMATKIPQTPHNKLEQILADADLEYLGTDLYDDISQLLYEEILFTKPDFDQKTWLQVQISFLENHTYFTDYCKTYRQPVKEEHLSRLKEKLAQFNS